MFCNTRKERKKEGIDKQIEIEREGGKNIWTIGKNEEGDINGFGI